MALRNEYYVKMVCSKMVCQKSDAIKSPSELVQVRVLRKAPYVKVGSPVREEELNSNRKLYPKMSFEHLILFKPLSPNCRTSKKLYRYAHQTLRSEKRRDRERSDDGANRLSQFAHVPSVLAEKCTLATRLAMIASSELSFSFLLSF